MNIFKGGLKLSGSLIAAAMIGFFLYISIGVIFSAMFTKNIGYTAYVYTKEGTDPIAQYEYLYTDNDGDGKDDGTDIQKIDYENQGYEVTTYKKVSQLEDVGKSAFLSVTQALCLIIIVFFSGGNVYRQGFKDANLVRTGHIKQDNLKGFKLGAVANIPFYAMFFIAVIFTTVVPNFRVTWYAFLNGNFIPAVLWIAKDADVVSKINVLQFVLLFLLQLIVPIISGVAYILGFKEINITDKLVYKKGEI